MSPLLQGDRQMSAIQGPPIGYSASSGPEQRSRMPNAMGGQRFKSCPELPVDLCKRQTGFRANRPTASLLVEPGFSELIQAVMQRMHLTGLHREPTCCRVASEPFQQIRTVFQHLIHSKALGSPG